MQVRAAFRHRRGGALIYGFFGMTAMMAFGVLGVDYGRTQVAKSQIQAATDAAVRAAGQKMAEGAPMADILAAAVGCASNNSVDGQPVVVRASDVKVGVYDLATRTFTETGDLTMANAIRIQLKYQFGVDGPALSFASITGNGDRTVKHRATVMVGSTPTGWSSTYTITTPPVTTTTPDTVLTETNVSEVFMPTPPAPAPTPAPTPEPEPTPVVVAPTPAPEPYVPPPEPTPAPEPVVLITPAPAPAPAPEPTITAPSGSSSSTTTTTTIIPGTTTTTPGTTTTVTTGSTTSTPRVIQVE